MTSGDTKVETRDGVDLAATIFPSSLSSQKVVIINAAMATPRGFYRHFAAALAASGYNTVTWDYRGIGDSAPANIRGFEAKMRDWGLIDMPSVIDWADSEFSPKKIFLIGHSAGGQLAGLIDNPERVNGMITLSAQSAYWRMQGGMQKTAVLFHTHLTLPLLSHLFGYLPWGRLFGGTDVPKKIALEWARWSRNPRYIRGDDTLPLDRYMQFTAPVLAYSIEDDDWGTARSVDSMMSAYPKLERRHLTPADYGLKKIGHLGYFRKGNTLLWNEAIEWLDQH